MYISYFIQNGQPVILIQTLDFDEAYDVLLLDVLKSLPNLDIKNFKYQMKGYPVYKANGNAWGILKN